MDLIKYVLWCAFHFLYDYLFSQDTINTKQEWIGASVLLYFVLTFSLSFLLFFKKSKIENNFIILVISLSITLFEFILILVLVDLIFLR